MDNKKTYLMHKKDGWTWDDHKYTAKEWVKGKWKYIYGNVKDAASKATKAISDTVEDIKDSKAAKAVKNTANKVSSSVSKAANAVSNEITKAKKNLIDTKTPAQVIGALVTESFTSTHQLNDKQLVKLKDSKYDDITAVTLTDTIKYWTEDYKDYEDISDIFDFYSAAIYDIIHGMAFEDIESTAATLLTLSGTAIPVMLGYDVYASIYNAWAKKENEKRREEAMLEEEQRRSQEEVDHLVDKMAKEKSTVIERTDDELLSFLKNMFSQNYSLIYQLYGASNDDKETYATGLTEEEKDEVMTSINTNYNPFDDDYGWEVNCYSCVLAYDLNNRGIDADAIWDDDGADADTIESMYKHPKVVEFDTNLYGYSSTEVNDIITSIEATYPEGAYGHFIVNWHNNGSYPTSGHDMVFEISNGEMIIRDPQSNDIYYQSTSSEYSGNTYSIEDIILACAALEVFRSDNLELNKYEQYVEIED